MTTTLLIALLIPAAYLLGSVSNAVWIGKTFYGTDVREHGSRNAGATNTMRVLGPKAGIAVFALDFLKGFLAVSLAAFLPYGAGSPALFNMKFALTAAVVLGHIFPLFAGFRGGKGVATLAERYSPSTRPPYCCAWPPSSSFSSSAATCRWPR